MTLTYEPMTVEYIHHCGDDLTTVNAARVSFAKQSLAMTDKDASLIDFLARENHRSPFNHAFITMRVKAPIFVIRQLVKHEYMPINEVSRRYVKSDPTFYRTQFRAAAKDLKQGSLPEAIDFGDEAVTIAAFTAYKEAIARGIAPESARSMLPLNTMTEWWWSGTLGAWLKMLGLRLKSDTQAESCEVAQMAHEIIQPLFPRSCAAILGGS